MAEKRLYWLKLREGFFSERAMKKLRRMAGGDTYTIIYLKLLLLGLRAGGKIYYEGVEDTFHEEIALELDEKPDDVQFCLLYLQKVGLIEIVSENELFLTETPELTYSESTSAARMRKLRAGKASQCDAHVTPALRGSDKTVTPDIDNKIKDNKTTDIENNSTNSTIPRSCKTTSEAEDKEEPAVYEFPCVKGETYIVTRSQIDSWMEDYPNVDVHQALRNARAWIRANPKRRKTLSGCPRFINGWLGRDQDSGKTPRRENNGDFAGNDAPSAWDAGTV